jgi:hypothetical protein
MWGFASYSKQLKVNLLDGAGTNLPNAGPFWGTMNRYLAKIGRGCVAAPGVQF